MTNNENLEVEMIIWTKDYYDLIDNNGERFVRVFIRNLEITGLEISYYSFLGILIDDTYLGTLDFINSKYPEIKTTEDYLNYLAINLDTPKKLTFFFEYMMEYTSDEKNYWQDANETIGRIDENGGMQGDCEDYAFLAKAIIERQGHNVFVVGIPKHAFCFWFEKNLSGKWDAYSLGTYGFDKNGNIYGMPVDIEKEKGYATLEEALNLLLVKYDKSGLGVENSINYRITNGKIDLFEISENGAHKICLCDVPINDLKNPLVFEKYDNFQME